SGRGGCMYLVRFRLSGCRSGGHHGGGGGGGGGHAHSFAHFNGPVVGHDQEVVHENAECSEGPGDAHGQKESRDGHKVVGEYTVKEPGVCHYVSAGGHHGGGGGGGHGHAHSFAHFHGPVVGPAEPVHVAHGHGHGHGHGHAIDYVAHPKYEYAYGVTDHKTGDSHGQKEHRDGHKVVGEYSLKEPGGNVRTVKYHADKDGFHAHVINSNGNDHSGGHHGHGHGHH
ncbi:hypothetical protein L9F63_002372, partial [Diploptera punctata]